jgi:hypothetical protein
MYEIHAPVATRLGELWRMSWLSSVMPATTIATATPIAGMV